MARPRSAVRSLTRPRAVSSTPSASDQIAAANAKLASVKANTGTTAATRRATREGAVDPRSLSPGERLIVRQQQEILKRMGIIQSQNTKILEGLASLGVATSNMEAEPEPKVSDPGGTVSLDPHLEVGPVSDGTVEVAPTAAPDDTVKPVSNRASDGTFVKSPGVDDDPPSAA